MTTFDAITITNLSKTYYQRKEVQIHAVKDICLGIPAGCIFGFLGPNGAGKTTTIKMICGLVQPTTGNILVNGQDVYRRRFAAMKQIGAVLEGTRNIHWPLSAWDNMIYFGHLKGMWGKSLSRRAEQLLKEMELWDRRDDLVRVFSRGMQQKVAVACALIADPPIILLDEPTLGLDVHAARTVKNLVVSMAKDYGKTVLLTTHQLDMAQDVCDRVAIIIKGQIITNQPVAELLDLFRKEYYQIKVSGTLPANIDFGVDGMKVEEKDDTIQISRPISGQDDLYGFIEKLRSFNLNLVSVDRAEPNLEEIFIHLVDAHGRQPEVGK